MEFTEMEKGVVVPDRGKGTVCGSVGVVYGLTAC